MLNTKGAILSNSVQRSFCLRHPTYPPWTGHSPSPSCNGQALTRPEQKLCSSKIVGMRNKKGEKRRQTTYLLDKILKRSLKLASIWPLDPARAGAVSALGELWALAPRVLGLGLSQKPKDTNDHAGQTGSGSQHLSVPQKNDKSHLCTQNLTEAIAVLGLSLPQTLPPVSHIKYSTRAAFVLWVWTEPPQLFADFAQLKQNCEPTRCVRLYGPLRYTVYLARSNITLKPRVADTSFSSAVGRLGVLTKQAALASQRTRRQLQRHKPGGRQTRQRPRNKELWWTNP